MTHKQKTLRIDGDPVAWARPRFNNGRAFTAEKQANAKSDIQWTFYQLWRAPLLSRPRAVFVKVEVFFKARRKSDIGRHKTTKPDADNLVKLIMDAGNGIIWEDDAQIAELKVSKMYDTVAYTLVSIEWREE